MQAEDEYTRTTCPGGYDFAGHVCDNSDCPPGYPRLTSTGWELSPRTA